MIVWIVIFVVLTFAVDFVHDKNGVYFFKSRFLFLDLLLNVFY